LLAAAFVIVSYVLIRQQRGLAAAAIAALSIALSPVLLQESVRLLSDIPFAVLVALLLWLYPGDRLDDLNPRSLMWLGVLLAGAYLVRTIGLAIWLGYAAAILFAATNR